MYWYIDRFGLRTQNVFLVFVSYVFYGWWSPEFLLLIVASTIVDYSVGLKLGSKNNPQNRKLWLWLSILTNLGLLITFKYYDFFISNMVSAMEMIGVEAHVSSLRLILPVGISFYTFQTMSYTIDVYRGSIKPTRDLTAFAAYVAFFPQLVAGPIERATNLIPQFITKRSFDLTLARDGLKQILWGMFKKVVIADNCAMYVDLIFSQSTELGSVDLIMGAVLFAFQIYGDFSGYSDIALGLAKLFGFQLMINFKTPYFSRDIGEFWRRWHISLSTWFRDYLYIPIGGSKGGPSKSVRNTFIVFVVSGFWHGANWTFVFWGLLNAIFFLPLLLAGRNRKHLSPIEPTRVSFRDLIAILVTFSLTCLAWVFFRAETLSGAFDYILRIATFSTPVSDVSAPLYLVFLILFMLTLEWFKQGAEFPLHQLSWSKPARRALYFVVFFLTAFFFQSNQSDFIYFQF